MLIKNEGKALYVIICILQRNWNLDYLRRNDTEIAQARYNEASGTADISYFFAAKKVLLCPFSI